MFIYLKLNINHENLNQFSTLLKGGKVLIENLGESIDPVLEPLLARNTIKKGKYIKIGDKEVEYHPDFK